MGIALIRALESAKPPDVRICFDPYARRFIPGWFYWFGWFFTSIGYAEMRGPGVQGFLAARDRYIDDHLQAAIEEGLEQLVILGAGYDSRAYRFEALKSRVKTFEVDHPVTQAEKLKRLVKIFGRVPAHVTYVGVDFNQQSLEERLLASGYNPALKTMFIWQGVTFYLTAAAVDATLAFINHHSGPGSKVIFDYMDLSVLEGGNRHGEVSGMRRYRGMIGEGLTFGIPDSTITAFLNARGYQQVRDARHVDLRRLYFTGKRQSRRIVSGYGIVTGVTPSRRDM
jgi:methyltransferase (TIGR00027 family)